MSRYGLEDRGRLAAGLRWSLSGLLVLAVHVGAIAALVREPEPVSTATGSEPAMEIDLEPVEGEKATDDMPPPEASGDLATAAAAAANSAASVDAPSPPPEPPKVEPVPPPPPPPEPPKVEPLPPPPPPPEPPKVEPLPPPPPPPEPPKVEPVPPPPPPPEPPKVKPVAPPPPPDPPKAEPVPPASQPMKTQVVPPTPPSPASAASAATAAAEETAPTVQKLSAGREVAWRGSLVAHLNRFRRFPPGLGSGTTRVGFTIDAEGQITTIGVIAGSGSSALDEAALSLVKRAIPFPKPPAGVTGKRLSFVVPIRFDGRQP